MRIPPTTMRFRLVTRADGSLHTLPIRCAGTKCAEGAGLRDSARVSARRVPSFEGELLWNFFSIACVSQSAFVSLMPPEGVTKLQFHLIYLREMFSLSFVTSGT